MKGEIFTFHLGNVVENAVLTELVVIVVDQHVGHDFLEANFILDVLNQSLSFRSISAIYAREFFGDNENGIPTSGGISSNKAFKLLTEF